MQWKAKILRPLAGLALACVLSACATSSVDVSRYVRDGVQYGKTEGRFRGQWWNYYERGRSFLEGGFYAEAEKDLRLALAGGRDRDQLWPRTYGLHFIPEYFPHRELGIAMFHQDRLQDGIAELELSLAERFSARGAYYLDLARKKRLEQQGGDTQPPQVSILSPDPASSVGGARTEVVGVARDDTYVSAITVAGKPFDVKVSAPEVRFSSQVVLHPGANQIEIVVTDLSGKTVSSQLSLQSDVDGPVLSFDTPVVAPGTIHGVALDPGKVAAVRVMGKTAILAESAAGLVAFSVELRKEDLKPPLRYEAEDGYGNRTEGVLPLDTMVVGQLPDGLVFARNAAGWTSVTDRVQAFLFENQVIAFAAVPEKSDESLRVDITNVREGQEYFMDEIVVMMSIHGPAPVQALRLNNEVFPTIPNRNSLRVSRRVQLHGGPNEVRVTVEDAEGRTAEVRRTVQRKPNDMEMKKGKLGIAFLGNVARAQNPAFAQEAESILDKLATDPAVSDRFTVVDRSLLREILAEQDLSERIATRRGKIDLGRIVPAEVMFAAWVREDQQSVDIVLEGTSTETGVRLVQRVDVAGPADQIESLIGDLGARLIQEFPRVQGKVTEVNQTGAAASEGVEEKPTAAFLIQATPADNPESVEDAEAFLVALMALPEITDQFTVVDRNLLREIESEQNVSELLGSREGKLALGKLAPAQVIFAVDVRRTGDTLTIAMEGINAETGVPRLRLEVSGATLERDRLVKELAARLLQEFPATIRSAPKGPAPGIACDLGRNQGVREFLKCLVYHVEDVRDPDSGEVLGARPVILREGIIRRAADTNSFAELLPLIRGQEGGAIETGQYVIMK
jgi:hypothetical protein